MVGCSAAVAGAWWLAAGAAKLTAPSISPPSSKPPLKTDDTINCDGDRSSNLNSKQPSRFVGRQQEVATLARLEGRRVWVLAGPAGVGKSRLLLHLQQQQQQQQQQQWQQRLRRWHGSTHGDSVLPDQDPLTDPDDVDDVERALASPRPVLRCDLRAVLCQQQRQIAASASLAATQGWLLTTWFPSWLRSQQSPDHTEQLARLEQLVVAQLATGLPAAVANRGGCGDGGAEIPPEAAANPEWTETGGDTLPLAPPPPLQDEAHPAPPPPTRLLELAAELASPAGPASDAGRSQTGPPPPPPRRDDFQPTVRATGSGGSGPARPAAVAALPPLLLLDHFPLAGFNFGGGGGGGGPGEHASAAAVEEEEQQQQQAAEEEEEGGRGERPPPLPQAAEEGGQQPATAAAAAAGGLFCSELLWWAAELAADGLATVVLVTETQPPAAASGGGGSGGGGGGGGEAAGLGPGWPVSSHLLEVLAPLWFGRSPRRGP